MERIYLQPFIATYSRVAFAKRYDRQSAVVAADLLNDPVVAWFESQEGLWGLVHEITARLEQNSRNSSQPPS